MENKSISEFFGDRLSQERTRLGLTQSKLAELMQVKPLTVIQYEKGITKPNLASIYRLQDAGFRLQFLLFGRENVPKPGDLPSDTFEQIVKTISSLENKIADGAFPPEVKYRMFLILLDQYLDAPSLKALSEKDVISSLVKML
ncbi:helix-turn-helix domain-containing protein [Undibacterium sp. Di24W]|uniref:helix-turn-helix domain-containing protein n=1 Tax=Undibacterium sp. Di24W TaxID=3413033 RepID=UPI003BF01092